MRHTTILFRALAASMLALVAAGPAGADTISIRSDYWYPYNGEPNHKNEGYIIDLLRESASATGDTIDYALMDWEMALGRTLEGSNDCVVGAIASDAPNHARTSLSWGRSQNMFYSLDDHGVKIRDVADLAKFRIGAVDDYSYGDAIDAVLAADGTQVTRVQASRRAFPVLAMKLVTGKVDVLIEDRNVADAALNDLGMNKRIRPVAEGLTEADDIYVACTPNERGRKLVAQFDATLQKARDSGELAHVLERYGLSDWATPEAPVTATAANSTAH